MADRKHGVRVVSLVVPTGALGQANIPDKLVEKEDENPPQNKH